MEYLLRAEEIPYGFQYPEGISKLIELNLLNYDVWHFMDRKSALERLKGVQARWKVASSLSMIMHLLDGSLEKCWSPYGNG